MPVQQFGALLSSLPKLRKHLIVVNIISLALAVLSFYLWDQPVALYFGRPDLRWFYFVNRTLTDLGLSEYYFAAAILTWAISLYVAPRFHNFHQRHSAKIDYARRWGLNFLLAQIFAGLIVLVLKFSVGRQRPHITPDFNPTVFAPFNAHWDFQSFPSGHSQVMFTAATMMSIAFPRASWLWLLCALIICFTRVVCHDHFVSDTIFGAAIGYTGTLLALYYIKKKKTANSLY